MNFYAVRSQIVGETLVTKFFSLQDMSSQLLSKVTLVEKVKSRFYGVYLLCSQSPEKRFNGKCYIGFTVNPNRRIRQHNRGKEFGGAKKTSNKGPWKMVMIIHGFPNNIAALQFEWAWQQPSLSSRLKCFPELKKKMPKETFFQYNFRILSRMLNVGPWQRLPLVIRWLESDYECGFVSPFIPPRHMTTVNGSVAIEKRFKQQQQNVSPRAIWAPECHLCMHKIENVEQSRIGCLNSLCKLTCHIICLANHLLSSDQSQKGHYIPIEGDCPLCDTPLLWVELLQRKRAMQYKFTEDDESYDDDDDIDINEDEELFNIDYNIMTQNIDEPPDSRDIYELSD